MIRQLVFVLLCEKKKEIRFAIFRNVSIRTKQDKEPIGLFIVRFKPTNMTVKQNIKFSKIPMMVFMGFKGFSLIFWCKEMINIWAILIITIIYFMLGALWFSPILFGKIWAAGLGFYLDAKSLTIKKIIRSVVTAFLATISLAIIIELIGTYDLLASLLVRLLIGIGFIFAIDLYDVLFEDKNIKAYIIDSGYHFISIMIAGLILSLW